MYYAGRNKLKILIDPLSVHLDASHELINRQVALTMVLNYLSEIVDNKIEVEIIFPKFLWNEKWRENYYSFIPGDVIPGETHYLTVIEDGKEVNSDWVKARIKDTRTYLESKSGEYLKLPKIDIKNPQTLIDSINNGSLLDYRDAEYIYKYGYMELVDLYFQYDCDFLLTNNRVLEKEKEQLSNKFKLFASYYPEIFEKVETFLKGHNIYISTALPIYGLDASNFYPMTDNKMMKYFQFSAKLSKLKNSPEMNEFLRVMFYHRYSFMKYSLDNIKFELLQAERLEDDKLRFNHYFILSYHLNSFYLNLWGFLDNLAWVFNYLYDLGFTKKEPMKVTFSHKKYVPALATKAPNVSAILSDKTFKQWLENLTLKRHPAAHKEPLMMTSLYDSKTNNLISEKVVVVDTKSGKRIFEAVRAFDEDFKQFEDFMDKVCSLFTQNDEK